MIKRTNMLDYEVSAHQQNVDYKIEFLFLR